MLELAPSPAIPIWLDPARWPSSPSTRRRSLGSVLRRAAVRAVVRFLVFVIAGAVVYVSTDAGAVHWAVH